MLKKNSNLLERLRKDEKYVNEIIIQNDCKYIIAYCRVSDSKQIDNYSPEAQLAYVERYAKENGFKIIKVFTVLGESSKRGSKRPSIKELLEFINITPHKIHSIVVFHSNRFARDGRFGDDFLDKIIAKGIGFTDLDEPRDIFTDKGRLRQVEAFYDAEEDNINRKHFINAITLEKIKQGYTMRRPPRGYKLYKTNKSQNKKQKVIITKEGELIKQAFQMKLNYNYTNVLICELMRPRGLNITPKALGGVFRNVYYCGVIKDRRLIEYNGYVEGRHPAMVTQEEFEIINYSNARKRQIRKKEIEQLPLKKHIICSSCNKKLTGYKASNRKDLFYYKCRTNGCNINIKSETLHNLYIQKLDSFSFNKKYLPQLEKMLGEIFKMINKSNIELKKTINTSITNLENERFQAIRNINANPDYMSELKELIEFCDKDLDDLKEQLSNVRVGIDEIKKNGLKALNFINDLSSIWSESNLVFKVKLQELIFPEGIWYNKSSNKLIAPKTNSIFNIIKDLEFYLDGCSKNNDAKNTNKGSQKKDTNKNKVRTSNILNNMLVTPSNIGSYEHHLQVLRQKKIPLVVLLSARSNILCSSNHDNQTNLLSDRSNISVSTNPIEIGYDESNLLSARSNNFGYELFDSMDELIRFTELYTIINNNI
jgi:DNA invertase Pin-like site-specific DNA recombinase